jgi:hypothetical protein
MLQSRKDNTEKTMTEAEKVLTAMAAIREGMMQEDEA